MTISVTATQLSNSVIQIVWTTDLVGTTSWNVRRNVDEAGFVSVANLVDTDLRQFSDAAGDLGESIVYRLVESPSSDQDDAAAIVIQDLEQPFTYGKIDPLASEIRYGDLDSVKQRLGFTTAEWDTELTQAIIAGEVAIDIAMGRSFPDTGANPEVVGIPEQIKQASENIGVKIFKTLDAPFGTAGSESFLGELDLTEMIRREIIFNPLISGYQIAWGVA